jgi:hypothetical protein
MLCLETTFTYGISFNGDVYDDGDDDDISLDRQILKRPLPRYICPLPNLSKKKPTGPE